jgi:hypothetical protein
MRNFLFVAAVLSVAAAPAFAGRTIPGGDVSGAAMQAGSTAGVASDQGSGAHAMTVGNGAVVMGAVSGNYTQVATGATATARPDGVRTGTTAQQVNVGATLIGGASSGKAVGSAGGSQTSSGSGDAAAQAKNLGIGAIAPAPRHGRGF